MPQQATDSKASVKIASRCCFHRSFLYLSASFTKAKKVALICVLSQRDRGLLRLRGKRTARIIIINHRLSLLRKGHKTTLTKNCFITYLFYINSENTASSKEKFSRLRQTIRLGNAR